MDLERKKHCKIGEEGKFYVEEGAAFIFLWKIINSCKGPWVQQPPTNSTGFLVWSLVGLLRVHPQPSRGSLICTHESSGLLLLAPHHADSQLVSKQEGSSSSSPKEPLGHYYHTSAGIRSREWSCKMRMMMIMITNPKRRTKENC